MLPAIVIGLREGLETVVIIGAIVVFLRAQGRGDLLRRVWRASAIAAAICVAIGFIIRLLEVNLPWRQQEQLETVVGFAAVCMVTYMIVWMRRFPKDLQRDSSAAAASALERDSGRPLVVLAFFAVLREGFEIAVFVIATIGMTGSSAWLATGGAFLGIAVALLVGIGIVRGSTHLDISRFFRLTALVLVVSAAGIAMATVHTANAAGWITFGQSPQFDLSWLVPPGSVLSSFTTGMFGLQPYPVIIEVVTWAVYFVIMVAVVLWPTKRAPATIAMTSDISEPTDNSEIVKTTGHRRSRASVGLIIGCVVVLACGVGIGIYAGISPSTTKVPAAKVLYSTLDDISCPSEQHCVAVGEFLPVDKDAGTGDPDGDGRAPHTLAEYSDGTSWHLLVSRDEGKGGAVLTGVSCATTEDCVAVGYYRPKKFPLSATVAPPNYPLVESFNGSTWRIVASPPIAPNSILDAVACPSVSSCVAVGYTTSSSGKNSIESFFVEAFNGQSWSIAPTTAPPRTSSGLSSVACPSVSSCIAVGDVAPTNDPSTTRPLIEQLVDGRWSSTPLPAGSAAEGILYDVTCTSLGQCMAVGYSEDPHSSDSALVLSLSGSIWRINTAALRVKGSTSLTTVACAGESYCVAAGTSWPSLAAGPQKILARVDAVNWHKLRSVAESANIDDIICPTSLRCILVGSASTNSFGNTKSLVASLAGSEWRPEQTPTP